MGKLLLSLAYPTLRFLINEGDGPAAADSIILIDELPAEIIFFNGDFDGAGPETGVIGFEESATSLTFNPAADALYSNAAVKPSSMAECTYSPLAGYDPNVTYLCFNPKGQMLGGNPNPSFCIKSRGRIQ